MTKQDWLKKFFVWRRHRARVARALLSAAGEIYTAKYAQKVCRRKDYMKVILRDLIAQVDLAYRESLGAKARGEGA